MGVLNSFLESLGFILDIIFKFKNMNTRVKLSTLWIVVMMNIIFADILSIMIAFTDKNIIDIIGEATTTMAIAAIITNIPILMIYFSRLENIKTNRILNIVSALITLIYVIGGGSSTPHYIICTFIEVMVLITIIWTAWKWKPSK